MTLSKQSKKELKRVHYENTVSKKYIDIFGRDQDYYELPYEYMEKLVQAAEFDTRMTRFGGKIRSGLTKFLSKFSSPKNK